ncbi:Putative uncharacterized protein [Paenibacillus sp. P22]|nr:Putative uncharacterized protein [Paenibacillus sp. P22]
MQLVVGRTFYEDRAFFQVDFDIFVNRTAKGTFRSFYRDHRFVQGNIHAARDGNRFATNTGHCCTSYRCGDLLPDVADDFAASFALTCFFVGHNSLGCGDNRDSETAEYARNLVGFRVNAQAGLTDTFQTSNDTLVVGAVFQENTDHPLLAVLDIFSVTNEALALENISDLLLDFRSGHFNGFMTNKIRVADTGKHICDRIRHNHSCVPPSRLKLITSWLF